MWYGKVSYYGTEKNSVPYCYVRYFREVQNHGMISEEYSAENNSVS